MVSTGAGISISPPAIMDGWMDGQADRQYTQETVHTQIKCAQFEDILQHTKSEVMPDHLKHL